MKNEWEMLDCSRDGPEELEEHSMVAYKVADQDLYCPYPNFFFIFYNEIKYHRSLHTDITVPRECFYVSAILDVAVPMFWNVFE